MRSLLRPLCLIFFCLLCAVSPVKAQEKARLPLNEPEKESNAQLDARLSTFIGLSDQDLILRFRQIFPDAVARTVDIRCLPDGRKETSILWIMVSGNTAARQGNAYDAKLALAYSTISMEHLKCTAHFYSLGGIIIEYAIEGDNCAW